MSEIDNRTAAQRAVDNWAADAESWWAATKRVVWGLATWLGIGVMVVNHQLNGVALAYVLSIILALLVPGQLHIMLAGDGEGISFHEQAAFWLAIGSWFVGWILPPLFWMTGSFADMDPLRQFLELIVHRLEVLQHILSRL